MADITEAEAYIRGWLSVLDREVHRDSMDQLEVIIQQWRKTRKTITSLHLVDQFNSIKYVTFRDEFLDTFDYPPFNAKIFDAIDNLMARLTHTDKGLKWSALFYRMFTDTSMPQNISATHKILTSLNRAREELPDNEQRFYVVCFMLQLAMEGIYDEIVRFVYVTEQVIQDKHIDPDKIEHLEIRDIRDRITRSQKQIIDVWDHAHRVRNAIAHARFRYDQNDKKMRFVDVDPRNPGNVFSKILSIEEAQELLNEIGVIEAAFKDLLALLEVYSTLITPLDKQYSFPPPA